MERQLSTRPRIADERPGSAAFVNESVRLQWLVIVVGMLCFAGVSAWLFSVGMWWLIVALVAVTSHAGYAAWREGLPLLPGQPHRAARAHT